MYLLKRPLDICITLLMAPLVVVILSVVVVVVRFKLGAPVFFQQLRPGLNGRIFRLYKLRTMAETRHPVTGLLLPDEVRLTSLGRWLRKTSLDELPQLWLVLKGEMSLVGPRPLLPHYLPLYSAAQARRHAVRPGITGWAQVNGRNALTWPEKLALDTWYADHCSLLLDLRILALTVGHVLRPRGINAPGEQPMPEFRGEQSD
jgi:lipopolysaccharide/colanic/teichoic acid biosynthesis glycosyltransferase